MAYVHRKIIKTVVVLLVLMPYDRLSLRGLLMPKATKKLKNTIASAKPLAAIDLTAMQTYSLAEKLFVKYRSDAAQPIPQEIKEIAMKAIYDAEIFVSAWEEQKEKPKIKTKLPVETLKAKTKKKK